jgi:hypothetical protein
VRVAVGSLDDPRVARALHADAGSLCRARAESGFRIWRLDCRDRAAVVRALRSEPVLAGAAVGARAVRLPFAWRRFPRFLGSVLTGAPGPFRVVERSDRRIVAVRAERRIVFLRLEPHAAAVAFRRGLVDEAPVPVGDLAAAQRDPAVRASVRVEQLLGVDLVDFHGALSRYPGLRRAYFDTADRFTYRTLVAERAAPTTVSLLDRGGDVTPAQYRAARVAIPDLPRLRVPFERPADPTGRYAASILYGAWRDVQLGPSLAPRARMRFRRVLAPYEAPEALLVAARPRDPRVRAALGLAQPRAALERADRSIRAAAQLVPLAWVADARLVSSCLRGWAEDRLGRTDYARVRKAAPCR